MLGHINEANLDGEAKKKAINSVALCKINETNLDCIADQTGDVPYTRAGHQSGAVRFDGLYANT